MTVQQHFANERTFLAWVRTSITVAGVGFLASGAVFRSARFQSIGQLLAAAIGIGSVLLGSLMVVLAARSYFIKRQGINEGHFHAERFTIMMIFLGLIIIDLFMIAFIAILFLA
ncbi:YidH family protein [Paenibacillus montanisoli]|uniref:DUF202 domain-containing protein n=1 Tax=Paenibacillus montanisoli TaxID=2081970 RepID=A0A328TYW6_9BACL|nr:DUF202 domain-containing protein [Paenibacillus montanisoli]RAP75707.1 DUF202 domain-containing protein [Paenibacillus montanisoli]